MTLIPGGTDSNATPTGWLRGVGEWVGLPLAKTGLAWLGGQISSIVGSIEFASPVAGTTLRIAGPAEAFIPILGRGLAKASPFIVGAGTLIDRFIKQTCFDMANPDLIPPIT